MKARLFSAMMVCCGLVLVATVMLAQAQEPAPAAQNVTALDALGTGFTYQGRLLLSGSPLSGTCDLQFTLWDAGTGGTQVGVTQTVTSLNVSDGGFTVVLDFGAAPFGGEARWLEVSVRSPAGSGSYTTLSPRQALTAVPYALYARAAPWSGLAGVPTGFADGVDNDTLYSAGTGLSLVGSTFHVVTSTIQQRVGGACGAGYAIRQVNADGTVLCEPMGGGAGDITAVYSGAGLSGGGASGDVTLTVTFAGSGGASTVARSDHQHDSSYWKLTGNAGTISGTHFLGTTDNQALELKVNSSRALRLEPNATSPNVLGGYSGNSVAEGVYGATIGGGGYGGRINRVLDTFGTVAGGSGNTAGWLGAIGGGLNNTTGIQMGAVAGGMHNAASGDMSSVGGGMMNTASDDYAVVGGGDENIASGKSATVGGGLVNVASGHYAVVGGGDHNTAFEWWSAVGGGQSNEVDGRFATIPGGCDNSAWGDYSLAAGRRAFAMHLGSFVWADSTDASFRSSAPNQFAVRATGGVSVEIGNGISLKINPNAGATVGGMRIENLIGSSSAELAVVAGVSGSSLAGSGVRGNSTYGDGVTGSSGKAGGGSFTGLQYGVYGEADPWYPLYPGPWYGVWGKTTQGTWSDMKTMGVKGEGGIGVSGTGDAGVYGEGLSYGGYFTTSSGVGLFGGVTGSHFTGVGVQGESTSPAGTGVYGYASHPDYAGTGVKGVGDGYAYGVFGQSTSGTGGYFKSTSGVGLRADSTSGDLIEARVPGNRRFYVSNVGNVYADGTYNSPAADLAEMLPAANGLQPGDVLVVGADGKLTRSSQPYQTTVVGVYSTQPGFLGGAGDETDLTGKVPLAVIGIVPVKVTAENGPILPGDALTTSSIPGHAMKAKAVTIEGMSVFPSGVIIGKAMERLDQGTATIQMLVMLQ
jgi:hypothetical protein